MLCVFYAFFSIFQCELFILKPSNTLCLRTLCTHCLKISWLYKKNLEKLFMCHDLYSQIFIPKLELEKLTGFYGLVVFFKIPPYKFKLYLLKVINFFLLPYFILVHLTGYLNFCNFVIIVKPFFYYNHKQAWS